VQQATDGPVHANIALVDPLTTVTDLTTPGRPDGAPWRSIVELPTTLYDASALRGKRVLVVAGLGAPACASWCAEYGFALIGDATVVGSLAYVDGLLRHDGFAAAMRPDVILRFGGAPSSKVLGSRIREWRVPVIGFTAYRPLSDPDGVITEVTSAHGVLPVQADSAYRGSWLAAEARCAQQFVGLDFASGALTETAIARAVVRASGQQDRPLVIGASMSVREVEWYGESRRAWTHSNRGVNGIDGVTSTTFGVASASSNGAIGLVGDVTFLHDLSALVDAPRTPTTIVVVDNAGGHIFDFLPQREDVDADAFAVLFTTARAVDIESVARSLGCAARTVQTVGELDQALADSATNEGVTVLVARPTPATTTTSFHGWLQRSCARVANELLA
jgi:2-succinyl-5-enolpyruvyl-6-hydroxy-3-cyclohexene-1-carboxylate synthase